MKIQDIFKEKFFHKLTIVLLSALLINSIILIFLEWDPFAKSETAVTNFAQQIASTPEEPPHQALLHVITHVTNDYGGNTVAADFTTHIKILGNDIIGSPVAGLESPGTTYTVDAGTYTVSAEAIPSYTASFSGDCDASGIVVLAPDNNKTCTIIITEAAPSINQISPANQGGGGSYSIMHPVKVPPTKSSSNTIEDPVPLIPSPTPPPTKITEPKIKTGLENPATTTPITTTPTTTSPSTLPITLPITSPSISPITSPTETTSPLTSPSTSPSTSSATTTSPIEQQRPVATTPLIRPIFPITKEASPFFWTQIVLLNLTVLSLGGTLYFRSR